MSFLGFMLFASLYNNFKLRRETARAIAAAEFGDDYLWGETDDEFDEVDELNEEYNDEW